MAVIHTYPTDTNLSNNDLLLGADGDNENITKKYTLGALATFIANSDSVVDTNFYLDGVTANSSTGVITFSMTGQDDITLDLGTSIFKDTSYFATADHTHTVSDILDENDITPYYLNVSGNGTSGQLLTSNGSGGFTWVDQASFITDNNYYLDGISKSGNALTFSVNGTSNQTFTFGAGAFLSIAEIIDEVEAGLDVSQITDDLGDLATENIVSSGLIQNNAVITSKILDDNIIESKLKISNSATSGYVLTSDGSDGFTWAANSASNYYVNNIAKSGNKLTFEVAGGLDSADFPSYTFGGAAFKDVATSTGRESTKLAPAHHTHVMAHITGAGALATRSNVEADQIADRAVTAAKLSPAAVGTNGQVLVINSSNELAWSTLSANVVNFLALGDTPSAFGTAGQMVKINSAADALEFVDFEVGRTDIDTTNTGTSGKVLAVDSNGDLEWVDASASLAGESINESYLDATNDPVDDYILSYDSNSGGFTWIANDIGDITGITAGDGLTGTDENGPIPTINVASATNGGINVNANDIELDFNDLASGSINTINDSFAFIDASDSNKTKKESIQDFLIGISGANLTYDTSTGVINAASYTLPEATSTAKGGIELFSDTDQSTAANSVTSTAGRTYGLQLNADGQGVVNVPWTDTVYTLPTATSTVKGGIELFNDTVQTVAANAVTTTASRTYGVQLNSDGQAVVNVPWVDTDTNTFRTVTAGGNTLSASETLAFTAGSNVTITEDGGAVTISSTDTAYSLPEATSTVRGGIELFSDTDQSVAANAVSSTANRTYGIQLNSDGQAVVNVPWVNTTYSVGDGGLTQKNFTTALNTKLTGIEALADVTDATNVTSSLVSATSISSGDKTTIQSNLGVDAAGTDNSTDVTLANTNYLSISGQEITGGTVPVGSGGTGATTAAAARTNLGVDAAGTDNSTDVTLAGSYDYLTISGQTITRNQIDLTTDVTGTLPVGNMAATALTTVQTAASEAAQLALTTQEGDVVVRSDENKTYMHNGGSAGTMADFTLLATPTDAVTSVAGKTGVVTLVKGDVGLGNVTNESKTTMFSSPTFTGTVSGVTASHVGLGNVTNESKTTMFTAPAFTGDATFDTDTLAIDSTNDRVGIGTTSPSTLLHVKKDDNVRLRLETNDTGTSTIQFGDTDDGNAGIIQYDHSVDEMYFDVNASERMRIDSSGNVKVGSASAQIGYWETDGVHDGYLVPYNSSGQVEIVSSFSSGGILFKTGTSKTERMRIDSSGNIGLGITSPAQHISGNERVLHIQNSNVASVNLDVNGGSGDCYVLSSTNGGNFQIYNDDTNTVNFLIDSNGQVGIGTTSPSEKLEVAGDVLIKDGSNDVNIYLGNTNYGFGIDYSTGDISIKTNNATRAVVTNSGNFGIGTTSPGVALDISSTDAVQIPSGTTAQRPTAAAGMLRYNSTTSEFEGYTSEWGSIGGGGATIAVKKFDGDDSTTAFTLDNSVKNNDSKFIQVFIDGVYQSDDNYSVSSTTLTFTTAPPTGTDNIEVVHFRNVTVTDIDDDAVTTAKIANGAVTTAKIANDAVTKDKVASDLRAVNQIGADDGDYIDFVADTKMDFYVNGSNEMRLESDGDLHVDGDVIAASTTVSSDEKLKNNITKYENALDTINAIKGVSFDWKRNGKKSGGVIAQDVQKVLPELVKEVKDLDSNDTHLTVDYNAIIGVLVEAVKELSEKVNKK